MTPIQTAIAVADEDPCDSSIRELTLLLRNESQDPSHLRPLLDKAIALNKSNPCSCRRLPLAIAVAVEVMDPCGDSDAKAQNYRAQAADADPAMKLAFAKLRFHALDRRACRLIQGIDLHDRVRGKKFRVAAWWAQLRLQHLEAEATPDKKLLQEV